MAETWKKLAFEEDVVTKALFDAQSVLAAVADDTPAAVTMAEQTLLGRLTGGDIDDIVIGIADNNVLQIDSADVGATEYAKFTASGLEGKTFAEVLGDLSGQAAAGFNFNSQVVTMEDLIIASGGSIGSAGEIDAFIIAADGTITIKTVVNAGTDTDKFLVLDGAGNVDFRTGAEVLSDIGGAGGNHDLLDGSVIQDSIAQAVTRGSLIYGNATPLWDELVIATGFLNGDGTDVAYKTYAETMGLLSGAAAAAFDLNGQQLQNLVLHTVADDAAKTALTQVLAMIVWQTDDACAYICTSVA